MLIESGHKQRQNHYLEKIKSLGREGHYKTEELNRTVVRTLEKPDFKQGYTCRRGLEQVLR